MNEEIFLVEFISRYVLCLYNLCQLATNYSVGIRKNSVSSYLMQYFSLGARLPNKKHNVTSFTEQIKDVGIFFGILS